MKIYTGVSGNRKKIATCKRLNIGFMISSCFGININISTRNNAPRFALDNGAFTCYRDGYPFDEYTFLKTLARCREKKIKLDFIVCPDIVGKDGHQSLAFSLMWSKRLQCDKLALVVSAPLQPMDIAPFIDRFSTIFVGGGNDDWQRETLPTWCQFGRETGKSVHLGMCGTLDKLNLAAACGVDSVDSTSFVRQNRFDIVEDFYAGRQMKCEACGQAIFDFGEKNG